MNRHTVMKTKELKSTLLVQIPQVSLDTGISEHWQPSFFTFQAAEWKTKQNKTTSLGNLITSKQRRNASRDSSMRQPDCLAVNPMVDKSLSSPSLSPTHNTQAAFKMLHS